MTATTEKLTPVSSLARTDLQLKDIVKTLPRECFQKNRRKAWLSACFSLFAVLLGYAGIIYLPWFLLPLTWIFTGTALTGCFVIAHDCGHRSFAKRRWVNDWVGHLFMLPLLYPFHSWRIMHNKHHVHTNKLYVDNAWHPWTPENYAQASSLVRGFYRIFRGYFWWLSSIVHWAMLHFNLSLFSQRERNQVKLSIAAVAIFAAVCWPTLLATSGVWGVVKFWLVPWLVYHFWMSTFTLVHHTAPNIQFRPAETWNAVEAQLYGTVHCRYPRWVEILCHDINVHIPHHISVAVPAYNLRMAHESLRQHWGDHLQERQFSWSLIREIVQECHLYDAENAYTAF
ncbi:MAG: fatty acid desaturase [Cyanophyceae cyanobacterium]